MKSVRFLTSWAIERTQTTNQKEEVMEERNLVNLAGEIVELNGTQGILKTTRKLERDGETTEYEDFHPVNFGKKGLKVGQRVNLFGNLVSVDSGKVVKAIPKSIKKLKKNEPDANEALIIGTMASDIRAYPAKPGKMGYANLLLKAAGEMVNAVAFAYLATKLNTDSPESPKARRGALVQILGRLRHREYENQEGAMVTVHEVVALDGTEVLKPAPSATAKFDAFLEEAGEVDKSADNKADNTARTATLLV